MIYVVKLILPEGEGRSWNSIPAIEMRNHFTMTTVGNSIGEQLVTA